MGNVMKALMPKVGGAPTASASASGARETWLVGSSPSTTPSPPSWPAPRTRSCARSRGHLGCELYLRGNVLTLDGDAGEVRTAETVVDELVDLIEQGHEIAPGTIEAVTGALDKHESPAEILEDVVWQHRNTRVAPKTVNQKRYVDSIRDHTITFGIGPAGTGKTFLAVAMAAAALSRGEVQRVILTRPAVEAGERLGFLPGDIQAKVDPYLRPLFDALYDMLDPERVNAYFERGTIEVRRWPSCAAGRLNDSFVILDEAQNTSPEQMKMFLTRLGFGSKMVVTGDITQIDLERGRRSGLVEVGEILYEVDGHQPSPASAARTSSATSSCSGSSPPTASTRARRTDGDPTSPTSRPSFAPAVEAALEAAGVDDGHLAVELVGEGGCAPSTTRHRGVDEATDVLAFPIDAEDGPPGPRELGDVFICPDQADGRGRGRRPRHPAPLRLRPRDRRRRDARAPGPGDGRARR